MRPDKKQRTCKHPPASVHPTYDPRWEICDLCHLIRPFVPPAPWILAHDLAQPIPAAPALFVVETETATKQERKRTA